MKIRIKRNAVRLRLSRTEVATFGSDGYLEERTDFGDTSFCYALQQDDPGNELRATFTNGTITMHIPAAMAATWVDTDLITLKHDAITKNGNVLHLLLEKDFKCIDAEVTEDQTDNYDNPLKTC